MLELQKMVADKIKGSDPGGITREPGNEQQSAVTGKLLKG